MKSWISIFTYLLLVTNTSLIAGSVRYEREVLFDVASKNVPGCKGQILVDWYFDVDENDNVWIFNYSQKKIYMYSPDGELKNTFNCTKSKIGNSGFQMFVRDGKILLIDRSNYLLLDENGNLLSLGRVHDSIYYCRFQDGLFIDFLSGKIILALGGDKSRLVDKKGIYENIIGKTTENPLDFSLKTSCGYYYRKDNPLIRTKCEYDGYSARNPSMLSKNGNILFGESPVQ